ncbi:hypothetical protein [Streptomyces sp. NPDC096012]|uniref:NucA/NucB deoxyribonuclease domain-containing protein n=1 Tax=Streptomyces sp. NPDC096012 TaxID=3155684 RepID=UPI00336AB2CF
MLAPRWGRFSPAELSRWPYPATKGAATFSYIAAMVLSARTGAEDRAEAQHIKTAFTHPEDTKPYMPAKKVPGQNVEAPLHRTVNVKRNDDNRNAAKKQCRRYWGAGYSLGNTRDCDEYPFASTYEGAAEHDYDPEAARSTSPSSPSPRKTTRPAVSS